MSKNLIVLLTLLFSFACGGSEIDPYIGQTQQALISQSNVTGAVSLFTVSNGQTRWWDLRLDVELVSGSGAFVSVKVNSSDPPTPEGGFFAFVDSVSFPERWSTNELLLSDGDVVSAQVDGGNVDIELSGEVLSEQL